MQGGDIASFQVQRFVFVFDDFIGRLPVKSRLPYRGFVAAHQWKRAFRLWDINPLVMAHMRDLFWRHQYRFDVVTWQPADMADEIREYLDSDNIPVAFVTSSTPETYERQLAFHPDIVKVFHADASRPFRFGGRGCLVTDLTGFQPLSA